MTIHLRNQELQRAKGDLPPSLSRDSSENGVSSRVEACRKRLRMIRTNHKGQIETLEVAGISVARNVEACTEMSRSPGVIEARSERLDEAGIT
jgi:hypothetical protein